MKTILNKISNLIKKGVISLTNNDSAAISYAQVSFLGKAQNAEFVYPYGMNANAPLNTMVALFSSGADEGNLMGIPHARQERFKELKDGEVIYGSPKTGSYIKFLENGDIEINAKGKLIINVLNNINATCQTFNFNGQAFNLTANTMSFTSGSFSFGFDTSGIFQGNGKFNFGTGGAAIARVGDSVQVGSDTGTITSGSPNNTSN